jgi:alpha-D-xyloside xylohydrolase
MQWHSEPSGGQFAGGADNGGDNDRSPWNLAERLGDERVLTIAGGFARLRQKLRPYLWREARHCAAAGRPMMAHLCLDFPDDPRAFAVQDEYMLGRGLLVAPLTKKGEEERAVYLPRGSWTEIFTGETVEGPREVRAQCPLSRIPVYRRGDVPGNMELTFGEEETCGK